MLILHFLVIWYLYYPYRMAEYPTGKDDLKSTPPLHTPIYSILVDLKSLAIPSFQTWQLWFKSLYLLPVPLLFPLLLKPNHPIVVYQAFIPFPHTNTLPKIYTTHFPPLKLPFSFFSSGSIYSLFLILSSVSLQVFTLWWCYFPSPTPVHYP